MELSAFVAARFGTAPRHPQAAPFASGLLAVDAARVSELIEQWRATSNRALPLTYAEFANVLAGDLRPSESILRAWDRLPLNRHRPESPDTAAYLKERRTALISDLSIEYESKARAILTRFAGVPASPRLYALFLAASSRNTRQAFFRRWAMPFPEGSSVAHGYIAAGSGYGKSELIKALVFERVRRNEGVVVFDPHGDMVQQIARWPEVAHGGKLVYLDPYLAGPEGLATPVLNPIDVIKTSPYQDAAVSYLVDCLQRVVGLAEITQRMTGLLRTVLPAIARQPRASLLDLWAAMGNQKRAGAEAIRESLAAHAEDNAINAEFIREDLKDGEYSNTRAAIRSRLQYLFSSKVFTRCVTGPSTINLRHEIDRGAVILVDLSGHMGTGVAADWGKFLLASLFSAAMSRQNVPPALRRSCFAYIDEADAFLNESIEDIYAKTRKYGLFLTVAQQVPGAGMTPTMASQVFGNSGMRVAGYSGDPSSAKRLAEITGAPEEAVQDLRRGEFLFRVPPKLYRASVRRDLRSFAHSITDAEWEAVKADQLRRYYRDHGSADAYPADALQDIAAETDAAALQAIRATE